MHCSNLRLNAGKIRTGDDGGVLVFNGGTCSSKCAGDLFVVSASSLEQVLNEQHCYSVDAIQYSFFFFTVINISLMKNHCAYF